VKRGLEHQLARQVAEQLTRHDALEAHARDELGLTETLRARPVQAALASAASFMLGSVVPILTVVAAPQQRITVVTTAAALLVLTALGGLAAGVGGAPKRRGALRMLVWGMLAMGVTALVGQLFGAVA
jgi:VIT1/CCC1 family predicted Fe2+/Mn2+ transporter